MSEYKEVIHDISTGEITERPFTKDELAAVAIAEAKAQAEREELASAETTKAAEKSALLAKLGITEDEAKLLLS